MDSGRGNYTLDNVQHRILGDFSESDAFLRGKGDRTISTFSRSDELVRALNPSGYRYAPAHLIGTTQLDSDSTTTTTCSQLLSAAVSILQHHHSCPFLLATARCRASLDRVEARNPRDFPVLTPNLQPSESQQQYHLPLTTAVPLTTSSLLNQSPLTTARLPRYLVLGLCSNRTVPRADR